MLHHLQATRLAREAVELQHAVEATHHLVRLAPAAGAVGIPFVERTARGGVREEVGGEVAGTVPVRDDLPRVVEVELLARLAVEHHERLEDRAARHADHRGRAGVAQLHAHPAEQLDLLRHGAVGGGEDLAVACYLVNHQKPPHRVLAAPEVPAPVARPAHRLPRRLGVAGNHELGVHVGAEVAVGPLEAHEAVRLGAQEGTELRVVLILRHTCGRDHQLAPELALPHAHRRIEDVVVGMRERLARLAHHHVAGEVGETALVHEDVELRADRPLDARPPQLRRIKRVAHGVRWKRIHALNGTRGRHRNQKHLFHARSIT